MPWAARAPAASPLASSLLALLTAAAARPEPLWGIPVLPAAEPAEPQALPQSLQAALQQILGPAAVAQDVTMEGIAALAAAMNAAMEEAPGEEGEGGDSSDEEAAAEAMAAGGVNALLQQLQQQAAAAAEEALPAAPGGDAGGVQVAEPPHAQHSQRIWAAAAPTEEGTAGLLWSLLGGGLAQLEAARRDPAGVQGAAGAAAVRRAVLACRG